jgi:hypothetical protein
MRYLVEQFIELLRESVITQGLLSLAVIIIIGHAAFTGSFGDLPKEFWMVAGTIIGFYFKAKNDNQIHKLTTENAKLIREAAAALSPPCDCQT